MSTLNGLVVVILLGLPSANHARAAAAVDAAEWRTLADLPYPLAHHMIAMVQTDSATHVYAIGGHRSPGSAMEKTCLRYSPGVDSWIERTPMRNARGQGQAVTVRGRIYIMGGYSSFGTGLGKVEIYTPNDNSWSTVTDMPESAYDFGAAAWHDSLVYVIGGGSWSPGLPPSEDIGIFDPDGDTWLAATPLPIALGAMAAGISGDTLLVAAGWTDSGPTNRAWRGVIDPSDPAAIAWTELDTLPGTRRCRPACAVVKGSLVLVGGLSLGDSAPGSMVALDEAWSLDALTGEWHRLPSKPRPLSSVAGSAASTRGRMYVPGGNPGVAPYLRVNELLDLTTPAHDVGVVSISSPVGRIIPEEVTPVVAVVRNFAAACDTFRARVQVLDTTMGTLVAEAETTVSLLGNSSLTVDFGCFIPESERVYRSVVAVALVGDENPDNDTLRRFSRTTRGSDPDGFGYVYESTQEPDTVTFCWDDTAGATVIGNWEPNGDDGVLRRRLSFDFPWYGAVFDRIYVCTNGYLATSALASGRNRELPDETQTDLIAAFWDDLDLRVSGAVYEKLFPDRAVYTWADVPRYGSPGESLTFQVEMTSAGTVRFSYLRLAGERTGSTVGIQGRDGSWFRYCSYVSNGLPANHVPADSTTIRFYNLNSAVSEPGNASRRSNAVRLELATVNRFRVPVRIHGPETGRLNISVCDATGRTLRVLRAVSRQPAAVGLCVWDGCDQDGKVLPGGTYFIRASTTTGGATARFLLLR